MLKNTKESKILDFGLSFTNWMKNMIVYIILKENVFLI